MMDEDSYMVFDIETVPDVRYEEYTRMFPKSKKRPGLHAFLSRVVAIGVATANEKTCVVADGDFVSERDLIEWFNRKCTSCPDARLVGYNIKNFDIPFLRTRAALLGASCSLPHRNSARIVDIYDLMGGKWQTDVSSGSLSELSWYLFGKPKDTGDGNQVATWFANGDMDRICEHCQEDIEICEKLYRSYKGILF